MTDRPFPDDMAVLEYDAKPWWRSKTIVFIGVSILAKSALLIGVEIDAQAITEITLLVLALIADIGGVWGRNRAKQPIRWRRAPEAPAGGPDPAGMRDDAPLPTDPGRDRSGYWTGDRGPFLGGD